MHSHLNARQLVLRVDSATGFAKVGWSADLPIGRFIHIELIGETPDYGEICQSNPLFEDFQKACLRAREINHPLLAAQYRHFIAKGCLPIPLNLNDNDADVGPDAFGNFHEAAIGAMFRLTGNFATVWGVIKEQMVVQLHSCQPPKTMEELEYQVWKRYILSQLAQYPGEIKTGKLIVQESGLWFCPIQSHEC